MYPILIKFALIVLATVRTAVSFPHSVSCTKHASNRFLWHRFDVFRLQRSMLVSGLSSRLEQLVRRWLAISENFCWHLWQTKAGTRCTSSCDSSSHDISWTKVSRLACQLLELPLRCYAVIRVSMCCLSCSALKLPMLDCDWVKCTPHAAKDLLTGKFGKHKRPQRVSAWASIVSALWLTALLSTASSWSSSFSLQTSDRGKKSTWNLTSPQISCIHFNC